MTASTIYTCDWCKQVIKSNDSIMAYDTTSKANLQLNEMTLRLDENPPTQMHFHTQCVIRMRAHHSK